MTELSVMYIMGAGMGALIAIYVILAVLIALGIYALVRLGILARKKAEPGPKKDCETCEELKEKEAKIEELNRVAEENAAALKEKDATIAALEARIRELEGRAPATVVIPVEMRSLSESLSAASAAPASGITKKSIIAYLSDKYGSDVEINARPNRTPNGKLLLSDNHFAFAPNGNRVCFVYVYETDLGNVVSLIKLDEPYVKGMILAHPDVKRSAFPKNRTKDWYSVVADQTFTQASYYAVLDHAIELIRGAAVEDGVAPVVEEPAVEVTLSESIAAAHETGAVGIVTKQSIIDHLAAKFGEKVELNGRANRTPNGKLLMSDNHFAFAPDGKRVCFTYIYQDDDGKVIILLRTTAEHAQDIHAAHVATGVKSAFPKNKEKDWYSVVVDNTFTEQGVYDELDRAAMYIIGSEVASVATEPAAEVTLSESIAAAHEAGAAGIVTKQSIMDHLATTFGEKVELNGRANRTPNGKLLMSDNHFAFAPDGKRVCFTYIYQDDDGKVIILLRTTATHAQTIRAEHKATGVRSAFPKNKEKDWYSVVVDGTFTEKGVYDELDRAVINIIGAAPVAEEPATEVSLSESIAAAHEAGAAGIVTKQSIIEHLAAKFGEKVELNGRANRTPNGKLLMSDNHFAFAPDGKRVCFTYIYQDDDGKVIILLRTTMEHAQTIRAAHKATGVRSAFPKNKEKDWYSVVVDNTFTEQGVYDELDRAAMYIIGSEVASVATEPAPEVSLGESLAAAHETGAVGIVTKQSIIEHLAAKFGDKVELNGRANRTPNGKLLMSDNHFALAEGKRVCFTYVYEDDGKIVMLVRLPAEKAAEVRVAHKTTGVKSAFPKNKDKDWYSVIVDASFSEADVYAVLVSAYEYVLTK